MANAWTGRPPKRKRAEGPNRHVQGHIHPSLYQRLERDRQAAERSMSEQVAAAIEAGYGAVAPDAHRLVRQTPFADRVRELMREGFREKVARRIAEKERGW